MGWKWVLGGCCILNKLVHSGNCAAFGVAFIVQVLYFLRSSRCDLSWLSFSHGILSSPFSGSSLVLCFVSLVDLGNLWHQGIIRVGITQQWAEWEENLGDGKSWGPLLLEDIKADWSVGVDVWMIDPGGEVDLWWLEWVVSWEVDVQEEDTTSIWWVIRSHDGSLPVVLILLIDWSSGAVGWWILTEIDKFFLNSLDSWHKNLYF